MRRDETLARLAQLRHTENFDAIALDIFQQQAKHNPLYSKYLSLLGCRPSCVSEISQIPFLPISFFKTHTLKTGKWASQTIFSSSGTTGRGASQHHVRDLTWYLSNAEQGFQQFYGSVEDWCIVALLPNYSERRGSSLVTMVEHFIRKSKHAHSGFFLHNFDDLRSCLIRCQSEGYATLLLGVSFSLLDFAEKHPMPLSGVTLMETGGMKGRRKEITRGELHAQLCQAFQVEKIHSEYGMTELFSQAYSLGDSIFFPTRTMKVLATEVNDPFCLAAPQKTGVLNIIDLANFDTLSFIATEDLGRVYADGSFEVLGRLDTAELRGCNLMVE